MLGGLALTKTGLRERDRRVLQACRTHGMPVVIVLAGGYARQVADTVDIHYATFVEAVAATAPGRHAELARTHRTRRIR